MDRSMQIEEDIARARSILPKSGLEDEKCLFVVEGSRCHLALRSESIIVDKELMDMTASMFAVNTQGVRALFGHRVTCDYDVLGIRDLKYTLDVEFRCPDDIVGSHSGIDKYEKHLTVPVVQLVPVAFNDYDDFRLPQL